MTTWLFILLVFILAISIWVMLKKSDQTAPVKNRKKPSGSKQKTNRFRGVSIKLCANACEQIQCFKDKRFLAVDITPLPVLGCTVKKCTCCYSHHDDRRSGDMRRFPGSSLQNTLIGHDNRFNVSDRRQQ